MKTSQLSYECESSSHLPPLSYNGPLPWAITWFQEPLQVKSDLQMKTVLELMKNSPYIAQTPFHHPTRSDLYENIATSDSEQ